MLSDMTTFAEIKKLSNNIMDYVMNQFVDFIIKVMIYPLIHYLPSMFYFLNNDSFSIGRIRNCINSLISVLEKKV